MSAKSNRIARRVKNVLGVNLLRLFAIATMVFLLLFIIMIFSQGGEVFLKEHVRNAPIENVAIRDAIIEDAVIVNGKLRDVFIEEGVVERGRLRKGVARDIRVENGIINSLLIGRLESFSLTITSATIVGNKAGHVFDDSGMLVGDSLSVNESVLASGRIIPYETKRFVGDTIIITTNARIADATVTNVTLTEGILFELEVPKAFRFRRPSLHFLTLGPVDGMTGGGILPAIIGTALLTLLAIVIALPLGVLAAIFLHEYGKPAKLITAIRTAINTLAGVPSIVFGLFGYVVFVNAFGWNTSILSGGVTLAILILPIIINSSEEALKAVPHDFREAAFGLGATKSQAILTVALPTALPSILTGAIISIGRAAGETAPILFTAAAFYTIGNPSSIMEECMALPYQIYALMTEGTAAVQESIAYGTAITLLGLVLVINTVAIILRYRLRKKRKW